MTEQLYQYRWGNNSSETGRNRLQWKGRKCRVLVRGTLNSCMVEFVDTKERVVISRNALRKAK